MARSLHRLAAIAALACASAAHAQSREVGQVGGWHIVASTNECTALAKADDASAMIGLIYPRPGKKPDAALMITSSVLFADARGSQPYPARLVLATDAGFDTGLQGVVPTGIALDDGRKGIRIAAPAAAFGDSLARAEAIRLEGIGRGTITLAVQDMDAMVGALRKCVAPE